MKKTQAIVLGVGLAFSSYVFSENLDRFYVKTDIGSSTYPSINVANSNITSSEKVGDAFSLAIGLELGEFLSFELGHNDFGSSSARFDTGGGIENYELELTSNSLSMIPSLSLGDKTRFFIELGEHVWDSDLSFSNAASQPSDGSDFFYTFGFTYDINDHFRTGFEHGRYNFDSENLKLLSVSLAYRI